MNTGNEEQAKLWNGPAGEAWVQGQQLLDGMFEPFERLLVEEAAGNAARRVLDVGCGSGATTLAIARRIGAGGECTGVDISEPLIALARQRAARENLAAQFRCADAQTAELPAAHFDLFVSRFGVMFFEDPIRAFANLRRSARQGAKLRAITFRAAAENPFMTTAERAAAPFAPDLPPRKADGPGQFGLADRTRTEDLLRESGWAGIELRAIDAECRFPAAELDTYMTRFGPVGLYVSQVDAVTRDRIIGAVRGAFEQYVRDGEVRFTAACWLVCANNR
jgi:SAM-dependent methyltransferase